MLEFEHPTLEDVEEVRIWRNNILYSLRTPFMLSKEMQQDYYKNVICNRVSNSRFWSAKKDNILIVFIGLVNIERENSLGEISIIINPNYRQKGYGKQAIRLLLHEGFMNMNLTNIYGECYECNPAINFWQQICKEYNAYTTILPQRKYWNGEYWDSLYFNINKKESNF